MQPLRQHLAQLQAAIAADDPVAFARTFTALVDRVGVAPAKAIAAALIAERPAAPSQPAAPATVATCA